MAKWIVTGAWKADGGEAQMTVEAVNQRAAEAIASQRGMVVEQAIPEVQAAQPVAMHYAAPPPPPRVQTVQATSKVWKLLTALSVLGVILFATMMFVGFGMSDPQRGGLNAAAVLGILGLVGSIGLGLVARICAWWFHG